MSSTLLTATHCLLPQLRPPLTKRARGCPEDDKACVCHYFNAEGKCYLTGMLKAAEILSLVCFEARFAEESHVPVPPGAGWVPVAVQSRTKARVLAPLGGCWQGQCGEREDKRSYKTWLAVKCRGGQMAIAFDTNTTFVVLTRWEVRQHCLVKFIPLKRA